MKILYIEDDPEQLDLILRGLEDEGQEVLGTTDEFEGLELARREQPDVILLDIRLSDLDGFALAAKLREMPELHSTLLLALTAGGDIGYRERALAAGCVGYLEKPLKPSEVMDRIRLYWEGLRELLPDSEQVRYTRMNSLHFAGNWVKLAEALKHYVTQMQQIEQQLIRSERRAVTGQAALAIAHEINNPLQIIQSALDNLAHETPPTARGHRYLEYARDATGRIRDMTQALLDPNTSKAEHVEDIDLADVVRGVFPLVQKQARDSAVELVFRDDGEPYSIQGARAALSQLLLNLISNAIEAMPDGGKVTVRIERDIGCLCLSVTDTGPGIADGGHLFEPFYTTNPEGHGLGLYVCRLIADMHHAELSWHNETPTGATFILKLPQRGGL
jgi:signal transduction histidine kinase